MKKTNKLLSVILAILMLVSSAIMTVSAAESEPEYGLDFVYDVNAKTATVTISVLGGSYSVGRFGFAYNSQALNLITNDGSVYDPETDKIYNVVIGADVPDEYVIITTAETKLSKNLIDTDDGTILFAWYANTSNEDNDYVNAEDEKVIAVVSFTLADDIANSNNPAEALNAVEDDLVRVITEVPEEAEGWGDIYALNKKGQGKITMDSNDVDVSETITADIENVTTKSSVSGTKITLTWDSRELEEDANIVSYNVVVIDALDNEVITIQVDEENLNNQNKYQIVIENENIVKGQTYTVKITPVTESGEVGVPKTISVKTKSSESGSGGGAAISYTVNFDAGEGSFAEDAKTKYLVSYNSFASEIPEVTAPEGKVFAGWSVDGETIVDVSTYKIVGETTFKALFKDKSELSHESYINGYPGDEVRPEGLLTRAEAATIIARISGDYDSTKTYASNFTDVSDDHWAYNYISYAFENEIVKGYEDNSFAPGNYITRAEFAAIIQRYFDVPTSDASKFDDVADDHWAATYIGACKDAGLIVGYENGQFRPENQITRAEAVTIINRALGRTPNSEAVDANIEESGVPFVDLDKSDWYFYEILEAAIQHIVSDFH